MNTAARNDIIHYAGTAECVVLLNDYQIIILDKHQDMPSLTIHDSIVYGEHFIV